MEYARYWIAARGTMFLFANMKNTEGFSLAFGLPRKVHEPQTQTDLQEELCRRELLQ